MKDGRHVVPPRYSTVCVQLLGVALEESVGLVWKWLWRSLWGWFGSGSGRAERVCGAKRKPNHVEGPRKTFARALGGSAKFSPVPGCFGFSHLLETFDIVSKSSVICSMVSFCKVACEKVTSGDSGNVRVMAGSD